MDKYNYNRRNETYKYYIKDVSIVEDREKEIWIVLFSINFYRILTIFTLQSLYNKYNYNRRKETCIYSYVRIGCLDSER